MKTHNNNIKSKAALLFAVILMAAGSGCSYVSDAVEGAITERSAFSIEANYDGLSQNVNIRWEETGGKNFAGYEIYISETQDDEYAGYVLVESRWRDETNFSTGTGDQESLNDVYTLTYSHYVNDIVYGTFPNGPGTYFYRMGIIKWDKDLNERTEKNGYSPPFDPNNPSDTSWDNEYNYNLHTKIDKISGAALVKIE